MYAIPRSDLARDQKLKSRKSTEHNDDDYELVSNSKRPINDILDDMKDDISEIVAAVHDLRELDKDSSIPVVCKHSITYPCNSTIG